MDPDSQSLMQLADAAGNQVIIVYTMYVSILYYRGTHTATTTSCCTLVRTFWRCSWKNGQEQDEQKVVFEIFMCIHINTEIHRLPFAFINTDVARATILCMLEEANKAEMVRNEMRKCLWVYLIG